MVAAVPMMIRGCAAGLSQRRTASSSLVGRDDTPDGGHARGDVEEDGAARAGHGRAGVVGDHGAVVVGRGLVHGLGRGPRAGGVRVHPLVVERARRVVVPHDVRARHGAVGELDSGVGQHPEEEVESERARRRAPVPFPLLSRWGEASRSRRPPATGRTPGASPSRRPGTR